MSIAITEAARRHTLSVDVVFRPSELTTDRIFEKSVVVFDVLRATTSITAALAASVSEIRVFKDTPSAAEAGRSFGKAALLCGEITCLRPPGFDLGNSPGDFKRELHADRIAFLSTTNGTKAIIAAREAATVLIGALVNATAIAQELISIGRNVTLLCAGTQGNYSMEDVIGAGAVIDALLVKEAATPMGDAARMAHRLFQSARSNLRESLSDTTSGGNLRAAYLETDIEFCARLDSIPVVGIIRDYPLRVINSAIATK